MQIERRLARLEAQNRRLRAGLYAVALTAVAAFTMGASNGVFDLVQARRIEVVDSDGHALVRLGELDGLGYAAVLDPLGNYKVQLNALAQGGTIALKNQKGQELVVLGHDSAGNGNVRTASASGGPLVALGAGESAGLVATYDSTGKEHVKLGTTYSGAGAMTTFNSSGARLISVTANTKGDGLIAAFEPGGRVRASWP